MQFGVEDFRQYFGNIFADSSVYPDERISSNLEDSAVEVTREIFRGHYRRALFHLTAHYLVTYTEMYQTSEFASGTPAVFAPRGAVSSVSVGDLSLSKELPDYSKSPDDKFLASTVFGQEFIRLRNKMGRGALLANKAMVERR